MIVGYCIGLGTLPGPTVKIASADGEKTKTGEKQEARAQLANPKGAVLLRVVSDVHVPTSGLPQPLVYEAVIHGEGGHESPPVTVFGEGWIGGKGIDLRVDAFCKKGPSGKHQVVKLDGWLLWPDGNRGAPSKTALKAGSSMPADVSMLPTHALADECERYAAERMDEFAARLKPFRGADVPVAVGEEELQGLMISPIEAEEVLLKAAAES